MTIQTINRIGYLQFPDNATSNQCKTTGHTDYRYELQVHCGMGTKLDRDGFIIDHQHLDNAVQKVHLSSCEKMGAEIISQVSRVLLLKDIPYQKISLRLQPVLNQQEEVKAFFEISKRRRFSWLRSMFGI